MQGNVLRIGWKSLLNSSENLPYYEYVSSVPEIFNTTPIKRWGYIYKYTRTHIYIKERNTAEGSVWIATETGIYC